MNKATNFILEKGYSNEVMITLEETSNTYTVKKEEAKNEKSILTINAVNCIPSITIAEKTYSDKFVYYRKEDSTVDCTLAMKIKSMDTENTYAKEICSIIVNVFTYTIYRLMERFK